ncbi:hypothetical protein PybrP1_011415, partial [[Pythium] brassicae (nom. inval.)]
TPTSSNSSAESLFAKRVFVIRDDEAVTFALRDLYLGSAGVVFSVNTAPGVIDAVSINGSGTAVAATVTLNETFSGDVSFSFGSSLSSCASNSSCFLDAVVTVSPRRFFAQSFTFHVKAAAATRLIASEYRSLSSVSTTGQFTVTVYPVPNAVELTLNTTNVTTLEDSAVTFIIMDAYLLDSDGSEALEVWLAVDPRFVSGVQVNGSERTITATGIVSLVNRTAKSTSLSRQSVRVQPLLNVAAEFKVDVFARGVEQATGESSQVTRRVNVTVTSVPDAPVLTANVTLCKVNQNQTCEVNLTSVALSDTDGSETLQLEVNDTQSSGIKSVKTRSGEMLQRTANGAFSLLGLPLASTNLGLRFVPATDWFGSTRIVVTAISTERDTGLQARTSLELALSFAATADAPLVAVEDTRQALGDWGRIGVVNVSLPVPTKASVTALSIFLVPRDPANVQVMAQSTLLILQSVPAVSPSGVFVVPAGANVAALTAKSSDKNTREIAFTVIVVAAVEASNTSRQTSNTTTLRFVGVALSATAFTLSEGATGSATVRLISAPTSPVTISFASSVAAKASVLPTTVTFSKTDWNANRTLQVVAANNFVEDANATVMLAATIASSDVVYASSAVDSITVQVVNDDFAGIALFQKVVTTAPVLVVAEARVFSGQFSVVLLAETTAPVQLAFSTNVSQLVVLPTSLRFTSANWNTSQSVAVYADENNVREGDHYGTIACAVTSEDALYAAKTVDPLKVTIVETKDTTPPPKVESARFLATGVGLTITFDRPVSRAMWVDNAFLCSVMFDLPATPASTEYFGDAPRCNWQTNDVSIRFVFGVGATVTPGGVLRLRGGLLKSTALANLTTAATNVTLLAPDSPPVPTVTISGAKSLGTCDDLFLDASTSSGSGGRAMSFTWLLVGSANTKSAPDAFSAALLNATTRNDMSLQIAAALVDEDASYDISLQVQNFFGMTSSPRVVTVKKAGMPLPIVSIRGGSKQEVYRAKELTVTAAAANPACIAASDNGTASVATASMNMNFSWIQLSGDLNATEFRSTSPNPRILRLPAQTLRVGVQYVFQIFVAMANNAKVNNTASVEVTVLPSSVAAVINGGDRTYGSENNLVLDASKSVDPDDTKNLAPFAFSWRCTQKSSATGSFDTSCVTVDSNALTLTPQAQTTIVANTLSPNQYYNFTVTATKDSRSSSASIVYFLKTGSPPSVTIESLASLKVNVNDRVVLKGVVISKLPVNRTEWSILGLSRAEQSAIFAVPAADRRTMVLKESSLTPGVAYQLQLYAQDTVGQNSTALVTVAVNAPPTSGQLSVTPRRGYSLEDKFACVASNWVDEDSPLKYTYKYIRGSAFSGGEEVSMGPASLDPSFSTIFTQGGGANYTITVVAYIQDALGAVTRVYQEIVVEEKIVAAENQAAYLANKTNAVLAEALSGDPAKVMNIISALGDLINGNDEATPSVATPAPTTTASPTGGSTLAPTTASLKSCPKLNSIECNGRGSCVRDPAGCLATDVSCLTTCSCKSGFYGGACSMDQAQYDAKQKVLGSLISAMATSSKSVDLSDVGAMEQQASSIATLTKSASVLDAASQALALTFVDNLMAAPVLTKSATVAVASTLSNLLDADPSAGASSSAASGSSSGPAAARRRLADLPGSSSSSSVGAGDAGKPPDPHGPVKKRLEQIQGTIGKLESALLSSAVAGEDAATLVSKNLKIVAKRDHVSHLEGAEIRVPLTPAEVAANYVPPSMKIPAGFSSYLKQSAGSSASADDDADAADPTIDVQSTVYTKNPYSFEGTTMNSRVMSVRVRQDGKDVSVSGLPAPFRIVMRNANPVYAAAAGTQQLPPQNFTFYCVPGTVDTKFFDCDGLPDPISVSCNGTEFNGLATCPVREPVCRYWDTGNSSWSSAGCVVAGTTDDGLYTICECTHLTDFSTDVQQSLALVTEHFDRVIHHVVTVEDVEKNVALLVVLGVFFVSYLVGFFYAHRWDHHDALRFKREKRMKLQQTEKIKIRSLFQEPEFLHAVGWRAKTHAALAGFWRGLKENHKLMSIVFQYNEHFSRAQRLTIIFTAIMSQMFTNALLYQLKRGPKSAGSAFVAGVVSSLCMVPVTIAFVAMFKKAARRQNYLLRYQVEDDEGNVAEVETDAYGQPRMYSPNEILSLDLAAIANCIEIARLQSVAEELKSKGVTSKAGQLCRGIFVALYNRDADEEPPEVDDAAAERDPLRGILIQIKSHLQVENRRSVLQQRATERQTSVVPFEGKKKARSASAATAESVASTSLLEPPTHESADPNRVPSQPPVDSLSKDDRRRLAMNQMLLMLGRQGGEGMVNDMLRFDPLHVSASSAAKIAVACKFVEEALQEGDAEHDSDDDAEAPESGAAEVMLTLQDWLVKCNESCLALQSNASLAVQKARLELQRTESQLRKLKHAIGAQFERRISEALAQVEVEQPLRGDPEAAAPSRDRVVVQLPTSRKRSTRRMSRLSKLAPDGAAPSVVQDRKLTASIRLETQAVIRANSVALREKRAAMKAAQRKMSEEQRTLRKEAQREMQRLLAGLRGVAKMKKKLAMYLDAREKKRVSALPMHEQQVYLAEKEQLKKIKRTSRILYNQFLRRQPARVSKPLFPEWVIYISYAICLGWSAWTAFFVVMFGFTIGQVESQLWVSSLVTGLAMTHVVSDPLKIFFRMGLMPIVAAGVLAESGLFNALGSETLAIGAVAAVGTAGVAQYMAKREERKRAKYRKTNRLVPTDQEVFVQALGIAAAGRVDDDDADADNAKAPSLNPPAGNRRGSFDDISSAGARNAVVVLAVEQDDTRVQAERDHRARIEAELEADARRAKAAEDETSKMPKLTVTKGPPMQLARPGVPASRVVQSSAAVPKALEQQSSRVLKDKPSSVFGPSVGARKPPLPLTRKHAGLNASQVPQPQRAPHPSAPTRSPESPAHVCPCGESVREQDWTAHQQNICPRRLVQCRAGCGMFLEARSRNGHELSQCRLVMCTCGKMVLTKSLELHQQRDCRNKTVFCRLGCSASMPSHQRERHERHECPLRVATCVHCGFLRHAADMSAHLATECHLQRATNAVSSAIGAFVPPPAGVAVSKVSLAPVRAGPPAARDVPPRDSAALQRERVGPPGRIAEAADTSPEKQRLAAMREKVLARKTAQQQAAVAPAAPVAFGPRASGSDVPAQTPRWTGPSASSVAIAAASTPLVEEETKLSPVRRKMLRHPPPVPTATVLSPREDEVLAAARVGDSRTEGVAAARGVDEQVDEIDRMLFAATTRDDSTQR